MADILRVDMTSLTVTHQPVPERYARLAGRALTSQMVADEVPPKCNPLGKDNKLVIAPGLLAGTTAPSSGRTSVGAKSPLTNGIKESNAGGLPGQKMGKLGIKAIVVEGQPQDKTLYVLKVTKDGAQLAPAGELAGMGCYKLNRKLWQAHGKKVGIIAIGPAGEMLLTNAGVSMNDIENGPGRYAGRGGLGAVMGSKGLKAIVIDDRDAPGVPIAEPERFKAAARRFAQDVLLKHPITSQALPTYGTAVLINILNEAGGLPTRNFSSGRFEGAAKVSGEAIAERIKQRGGKGKTGHPCHPGCVIRCSNIYPDEKGKPLVACLEY
ncbi:MAG: aldehyde ferredoxin oxidoreductase, partial [Planctomycetes bacterium]|nr:aldehyde ferredoxin oxidoreductase [Planctomycetota bacterium]